ncbi:MAG: excinuclease ABC subunit C [Verrucomicrobia bacterium]|nr:MAG: excinuclease ABC subunit C [Verrucomicrobiota bacterium]
MRTFTYVYVLQSVADPNRFYMGCASDLRARLARHNNGEVPHTAKSKPWQIKTYVAFSDRDRARKFERYLKSASGRAFLKKRL